MLSQSTQAILFFRFVFSSVLPLFLFFIYLSSSDLVIFRIIVAVLRDYENSTWRSLILLFHVIETFQLKKFCSVYFPEKYTKSHVWKEIRKFESGSFLYSTGLFLDLYVHSLQFPTFFRNFMFGFRESAGKLK